MKGLLKPTKSNHSMYQASATSRAVAVASDGWYEWKQPFKNFPASGNSIRRIEKSVFHSVYRDTCHRISLSLAMVSMVPEFSRSCKLG
jgi:hypothetical protein